MRYRRGVTELCTRCRQRNAIGGLCHVCLQRDRERLARVAQGPRQCCPCDAPECDGVNHPPFGGSVARVEPREDEHERPMSAAIPIKEKP